MSPHIRVKPGGSLSVAWILVLSSVGVSSCMHLGMMGTDGGHHSDTGHATTAETLLEKEVIIGNVKAIALFPALKPGQGVTLTLRLMDTKTSTPLSGEQVSMHVRYDHRLAPPTDHQKDSTQTTDIEHDINIEQDVLESSTPGVYTIPYSSYQSGEHVLMFHISAIGDRKLEPEITVEGKRTLSGEAHAHQGDMPAGTNTGTYVIVGAALMGALMAAMLFAHGDMF